MKLKSADENVERESICNMVNNECNQQYMDNVTSCRGYTAVLHNGNKLANMY